MITATWDTNVQYVVRVDYTNPVLSWDEYDHAVDEAYSLVRQADRPVIVIHNAGHTRMPPGNAFLHLRRAWLNEPDNLQVQVAVISHRLAADTVNLSLRFLRSKRFYSVVSLEQAYQYIAELRKKSA